MAKNAGIRASELTPKKFGAMLGFILVIFFTLIFVMSQQPTETGAQELGIEVTVPDEAAEAGAQDAGGNEPAADGASEESAAEGDADGGLEDGDGGQEAESLKVRAYFDTTTSGKENFDIGYDGDEFSVVSNPPGAGAWAISFTVDEGIETFAFEYTESGSIQSSDPYFRINFYGDGVAMTHSNIGFPPEAEYFYLADSRVDWGFGYPIGRYEMWGPAKCKSSGKECDSIKDDGKAGHIIMSSDYLNALADGYQEKELPVNMEGPVTVFMQGNHLVTKNDHSWGIRGLMVGGKPVEIIYFANQRENVRAYPR